MTTNDDHEAFEELNERLAEPPSAAAWDRVCKMLRRWPDKARRDAQATPYVARAVASWPSALRVSQPWMIREALQGRSAMVSALCLHVEIEDKLLPAQLAGLVEAGAFERVESLRLLPGAEAHGESIILMTSERLPALRALALEGQLLKDSDLAALEGATSGPSIERLSLVRNKLTSQTLERLAAWPGATRLTELTLSGETWPPAGAPGALALPALRSLTLVYVDLRNDGLEWLLASPMLDGLTQLRPGSLYVSREVFHALLREPVCSHLEVFECHWASAEASAEEIAGLQRVRAERGAPWSAAVEAWVEDAIDAIQRRLTEKMLADERYYNNDSWE
jgi:hypothetical protein